MTGPAQLADDLARLGLTAGDRVLVHSSLRAMGQLEGGPSAVVQALQTVLGPNGTLVVPTFNYFVDASEEVDLSQVPGRTGAITEAVRLLPGSIRSDHPTHSVVAVGRDAKELTSDHLATRAFGVGSPLSRLAQTGGKVLLLGVGHTSNSTVHVAEEHVGLPKPDPVGGLDIVQVRCTDGQLRRCQLDTSTSCSFAFGTVEYDLRSRKAILDGRVGRALTQVMSGQSILDAVADLLGRRADALLCTRSECEPCGRTRSALENWTPATAT